jgi:hypothetical protein
MMKPKRSTIGFIGGCLLFFVLGFSVFGQDQSVKKEFSNSFVPGFQGGGIYLFRDQVFYWGGEVRFDFSYNLDTQRPTARAIDRGRSEIFVSAGLYYAPRSDARFLCQYLIGFAVSFETPNALSRNFLIPCLGLAVGGITIADRGTGFSALPFFALNIVSLERFSLGLETGLLLSTMAFEEFLALKTNLALMFVF